MINELKNKVRRSDHAIWLFILVISHLLVSGISAQQTVLYRDAEADFSNLVKEYEQGLYGRCIRSADKYKAVYKEPAFEQFALEAELYKLKAGLNIGNPNIIVNYRVPNVAT